MKAFWIAAAALAALAGRAAAEPLPEGGLTLQETQAWLQKAGYEATLQTPDDGEPYIAVSDQGVNFDVYGYDCAPVRCTSIQLRASFDVTEPMSTQTINEWNTTKRYTKAWIDDQGDPVLEYDINLSPGSSYEALQDDLALWGSMLGAFFEFLGW